MNYCYFTGEHAVVNIDGMTCDACVQTIQSNVAKVPGIISIVVSYVHVYLRFYFYSNATLYEVQFIDISFWTNIKFEKF